MAVTLSRLRIWFAAMALLIISVVAGYYVYARYQQAILLRNLPGKVGINIQQSTEGFTLSKSEGGRTLFTIHADKATQFKDGGGRAELHAVNIVVYGRNSDRYDQISGENFDYDPQQGAVTAKGTVSIDLEGNSQGSKLADQAPPPEMQNPIHLRAEGMVFNQKTGQAASEGHVEFRVPHASGEARGASYDSKKNELQLSSDVVLHTEGAEPSTLQAARGAFTKEPHRLTLEQVVMTTGERKLWADHAVADLAADNSIQQVRASGNVHLAEQGGIEVRSPQAELKLGSQNAVQGARFFGGVDFASNQQGAVGHSGELLLHFVQVNAPAPPRKESGKDEALQAQNSRVELRMVDAMQQVTLHQAPQPGAASPQSYAISSEAMTMEMVDGRQMSTARTHGPGELVITPESAKNKGERTVIDALLFTADFFGAQGGQNKLRTVHGTGDVRVTSHVPGQPDKLSSSQTMVANFTEAGEMATVEQAGNFRFSEGQSSPNEPGGRRGYAQRATYTPGDDSIVMLGSPRVVDGGVTVTADVIRLLRRSSEAFAQGNVKSTYSELKVQPDGALLATADPVHVTAQAMNATQLTGVAHYSGGARLWQGANTVEGRTIEFDQKARSIVAVGDRKRPVSSVFVQVDSKGKTSTMVVTAPRLNYVDQQRQAIYSGGVTARGDNGGVLTADHADVFLNPAGASAAAGGPSQLDHIIASTHVQVQQQERRAEGERLLYTASNGSFVMTGGSPWMRDPVNGTVRGDSLTFFSRDDRVIVEGSGSSRAVTHTHVSR